MRPYLAEVGSEGELADRLWRRGLEVTLAEVAGLGEALPTGTSEDLIASLVAQRLLLCVPLLRRTGKLALLGLELPRATIPASAIVPDVPPGAATESIDESAAGAIAGLGGNDFL